MAVPQEQYKDRLFSFIFGAEDHKDWTLELYNAINETDYTDTSLVEFTTIKEVLYLGMHNDVSFLISNTMSLWEQQSSYNPNMPLRFLQYLGQLYERYITERKKNKYGRTLVHLPVPRLITFYNGLGQMEEEVSLRLTDAFPTEHKDASDVEVRVRMVNVNYGHNCDLLNACRPLKEYAWIVDRIRFHQQSLHVEKDIRLETAIDRTIDELPDDFVTKLFLVAHRAEVKGMLLTEYDEAKTMELFKEEGREEGKAEGFNLLGALVKKLMDLGRSDDVVRVSVDPSYRDRLLREFSLA